MKVKQRIVKKEKKFYYFSVLLAGMQDTRSSKNNCLFYANSEILKYFFFRISGLFPINFTPTLLCSIVGGELP